jgi:hypothetical protein
LPRRPLASLSLLGAVLLWALLSPSAPAQVASEAPSAHHGPTAGEAGGARQPERVQPVPRRLQERLSDRARRALRRSRATPGAVRPKALPDGLTQYPVAQRFVPVNNPNPELNFDVLGTPRRAGDVNGDGTADYLYRAPAARDERTDDLEDTVGKTALFFGGGTPPESPDQVLYHDLRPVGDLNGDGNADAIEYVGDTNGDGRDELRVYEGTANGFSRIEATVESDTLSENTVVGFVDVDGDGAGDALLAGDGAFQVLYGGTSLGDITLRKYDPSPQVRGPQTVYGVADLDGDSTASVVRLGEEAPSDSVVTRVFNGGSSRDLSTAQSFDPEGVTDVSSSQTQLSLVDVNGSGRREIVVTEGIDAPSYVYAAGGASTYASSPVVFQKDDAIPIGDLNGDGNHDFYTYDEDTRTRYVAYGPDDLSSGLAFDTEIPYGDRTQGRAEYLPTGGLGDVTGDGTDDAILGFEELTDRPFQVGRRVVAGRTDNTVGLATQTYPRAHFYDRIGRVLNAGDLNDDGTDDLAVVFVDRATVGVYYGGSSIAGTPDVSLSLSGGRFPVNAETGDFNGDGVADLAVPFDGGGVSGISRIAIYHGGADFDGSPEQALSFADAAPSGFVDGDGFQRVATVGDVNGDGVDDFAATSFLTQNDAGEYLNRLHLYYGGSSLPSSPSTTIDYRDSLGTGYLGFREIRGLGDFNGDGADDFAVGLSATSNPTAGGEGRVHVFYGGSDAAFDRAGRTIFPPSEGNQNFGFRLAGGGDINADGAPDLVVTSAVSFFAEDASFAYGYHGRRGGAGPDLRIEVPANAVEGTDVDDDGQVDVEFGPLQTADLNRDGTSEILVGFRGGTNALVYREGSGEALSPDAAFRAPDQTVGLGSFYGFATGDFTGSGRTDAVFSQNGDQAAFQTDRFYRFRGPTPPTTRFAPPEVFASPPGAENVVLAAHADVDGDGDQDALVRAYYGAEATPRNELFLYRNDGSGAFGPSQVIRSGERASDDVALGDLNGDDAPDLVRANADENRIVWHANQGDGTFGAAREITRTAASVRGIDVGDVDGDNAPDVISAQAVLAGTEGDGARGLAWYPNEIGAADADADGFGTRRVATDVYRAQDPQLVDVDRDGALDVLFRTREGDRLRYLPNRGGGSFGDLQAVAVDNGDAEAVRPADVDRDGTYDVLGSGPAGTGWYANEGDGAFAPRAAIGSGPGGEAAVAADLNADGLVDVLHSRQLEGDPDELVRHLATDTSAFGGAARIPVSAPRIDRVYPVALDGDGDYDLLVRAGGRPPSRLDNAETSAPAAPGGLTASATDRGVDLSWSAADGASGYNVYRALRPFYNPAEAVRVNDDPVSGTSFTDASGAGGQRFYYRVTTVGPDGGESAPSGSGDAVLEVVDARSSARVTADASVDFGETGVTVDFAGTQGEGTVEVTRYGNPPAGSRSLGTRNVSDYRFVADVQGDLTVGPDTEVRVDVSRLEGVSAPEEVAVYRRETAGTGAFERLATAYDEAAGELVATTEGFSEFALGSDTNPLPVELARFEATAREDRVRLRWQTASERGNAGFAVQRQVFTDGETGAPTWTKQGFVESKADGGSTTEPQRYRFVDRRLPFAADSVRYRLRQVDADGDASHSDAVTVARQVDRVRLLGTAPNPARQVARVRFAVPEPTDVTVRLYDVLGRRVRTVRRGTAEGRVEAQVDVSDLAAGVYFLRLRAGKETKTRRLTVVK